MTRSMSPSLSKSPAAAEITPFRFCRPESAARSVPWRYSFTPSGDQVRRAGWPAEGPVVVGGFGGLSERRHPRRIVNLRVIAPLDVFRNSRSFGLLLEVLEGGQLARGFLRAPAGAVKVIKLEMRGGEERIELGGALEFCLGLGALVIGAVERAQLVVADGLTGHELHEFEELRQRLLGLVLLLVIDAEVEPRVRQLGVAVLDLLQKRHGFGGASAAQQGEGVVQLLRDGIRRHVEGLLELGDRFVMRGRVFVERFAEVAVALQLLFARRRRPEDDAGYGDRGQRR